METLESVETVETVETDDSKNSLQKNELTLISQGKVAQTTQEIINNLTDEQKQQALKIKESLDITKPDTIMNFGADSYKILSNSADKILSKANGRDNEAISNLISEMMNRVNEVMPEDIEKAKKRGLFSWGKKQVRKKMVELMVKAKSIEASLTEISGQLVNQRNKLVNSNNVLNQMFDDSKVYFESLNVEIAGGQLKLDELVNDIIPKLKSEYAKSNDPFTQQEIMKLESIRNDLEVHIDGLMRSRDVIVTQSYQIQIIQQGNNELAKKLDKSLSEVMPLWKSQMTMMMMMSETEYALATLDCVNDTTNKLYLSVASQVKETGISIAQRSNQPTLTNETLKKMHQDLIDTLKGVKEAYNEGTQKRLEGMNLMLEEQKRLEEEINKMSKGEESNIYFSAR